MKKAILAAGIILISTGSLAQEKRFDIPLGDSPSRGPQDAKVTMVEFIDFQ